MAMLLHCLQQLAEATVQTHKVCRELDGHVVYCWLGCQDVVCDFLNVTAFTGTGFFTMFPRTCLTGVLFAVVGNTLFVSAALNFNVCRLQFGDDSHFTPRIREVYPSLVMQSTSAWCLLQLEDPVVRVE